MGGDNLEFTAGRTFDGEVPNPVEFMHWIQVEGKYVINITLKFMVTNSVIVVDHTLFLSR